jgi:hypothetical protein
LFEKTPASPFKEASGQEDRKSILDSRQLGWFMREASCLGVTTEQALFRNDFLQGFFDHFSS